MSTPHAGPTRRHWEWIGALAAVTSAIAAVVGIAVRHSDATADDHRSASASSSVAPPPGAAQDARSTLSGGGPSASAGINQFSPEGLSLPEAYVGTWSGTVNQENSTYSVLLTLTDAEVGKSAGQSQYSSLPCNGELTLTSGGNDVRMKEQVDDRTVCVHAELRLRINADGTLDYTTLGSSGKIGRATLAHPAGK